MWIHHINIFDVGDAKWCIDEKKKPVLVLGCILMFILVFTFNFVAFSFNKILNFWHPQLHLMLICFNDRYLYGILVAGNVSP